MTSWRLPLLGALLLAAATAWVFWPATGYDFILLDDPLYVSGNPALQEGFGGGGALTAFARPTGKLYTPVTTLSLMADAAIFGPGPRGFHLVNVLLHSLNMGIFFLILWRMTGMPWRSLAAAGLTALHPLRVESVAWVSERKDVLAAFFLLLALAAWLRFLRTRRRGWFLAVFALFSLGLLAKPVIVTFPLLLLLLDFWPLKRTGGTEAGGRGLLPRLAPLVHEKLLLLLPAGAAAAATVAANLPTLSPIEGAASLLSRAETVLSTFLVYLKTTFWPAALFLLPGFPVPEPSWGRTALAGGALAAVTFAALRWRRRAPWLAFAWSWYLVSLLPNSRLLPSTFSLGDRFTYLPHLGLAVGVAWGIGEVLPRGRLRPAAAALISLAVLGALSGMTRSQLPRWKDSLAVSSRAMALLPPGLWAPAKASSSLLPPGPALLVLHGTALLEAGRVDEGTAALEKAVALAPAHAAPRQALARALDSAGRTTEAVARMKEALALRDAPENLPAKLFELGRMQRRAGRNEEGVGNLLLALEKDPGLAEGHLEAGAGLARMGFPGEALVHFRRAAALDPGNPLYRLRLGEELRATGQAGEARVEFTWLAARFPGSAEALFAEGRLREMGGEGEAAGRSLDLALRSPPAHPGTPDAIREILERR